MLIEQLREKVLIYKCKLMTSMVGSFFLGSLLGADCLLSYRFVRVNGYAPKVISSCFKYWRMQLLS